MGTPEFAVPSLEILHKNGFAVSCVVTAPDKPAGRGQKIKQSAVKTYAIANGLKILQPTLLKDLVFLKELAALKANLYVVVAFRMLPEEVWGMPDYGTINLHASLLPDYRGAAPINHAIMNGEEETGLTTFFIRHEIDTGDILFQQKVKIQNQETAGELHARMKEIGAGLLLKTVVAISSGDYKRRVQDDLMIKSTGELKKAPKIFHNDCKINWKNNSDSIYNQIRGLSPYPAAYTELKSAGGKGFLIKVFEVEKHLVRHQDIPGSIHTDGKKELCIFSNDGWLNLKKVQLEGRGKHDIEQFLRGFKINNSWVAV